MYTQCRNDYQESLTSNWNCAQAEDDATVDDEKYVCDSDTQDLSSLEPEGYTSQSVNSGIDGFVFYQLSTINREPYECGWDVEGFLDGNPSINDMWEAQSPAECAAMCEIFTGESNVEFCAGFYWTSKYIGSAKGSADERTGACRPFRRLTVDREGPEDNEWSNEETFWEYMGDDSEYRFYDPFETNVKFLFTRSWLDVFDDYPIQSLAPADEACGGGYSGELFYWGMLSSSSIKNTNGVYPSSFFYQFQAVKAYDPSHCAEWCDEAVNCQGFIWNDYAPSTTVDISDRPDDDRRYGWFWRHKFKDDQPDFYLTGVTYGSLARDNTLDGTCQPDGCTTESSQDNLGSLFRLICTRNGIEVPVTSSMEIDGACTEV